MVYEVTEKADRFKVSCGCVIRPEGLPQHRAALALMMHREAFQTQLPSEALEWLEEQGYLKEVEE